MKNRIRIIVGVVAVAAIALQAPAFFNSEDNIAYGYSVEKTLTKPISQSKTSSSNSFTATLDYNDVEGYTGMLSKDGSSFVKSGSYDPGHSHDPSGCGSGHGYDKCLEKGSGALNSSGEYRCNACGFWLYEYGFRVVPVVKCYKCGATTASYGRDPVYKISGGANTCYYKFTQPGMECVYSAKYSSIYASSSPRDMEGHYYSCGMQERSPSDTRIYQQNYSGTVYKTIKEYPKLTGITVLQQPTKFQYQECQDFDTSGMVVEATYVDGHKEIIQMKNREGDIIS